MYISPKKICHLVFDKPLISHRNHEKIVKLIHNKWNKNKLHQDLDYELVYLKLRYDYTLFRHKKNGKNTKWKFN